MQGKIFKYRNSVKLKICLKLVSVEQDINKYFQRSAKFSQGLIVNDKYFRNIFHLNLHDNQDGFEFF